MATNKMTEERVEDIRISVFDQLVLLAGYYAEQHPKKQDAKEAGIDAVMQEVREVLQFRILGKE